MSGTHYGLVGTVEGSIDVGIVYNDVAEATGHVTNNVAVQKIGLSTWSETDQISVVNCLNYDNDGAIAAGTVAGMRCDKTTQRPYIVSLLRGGSCGGGSGGGGGGSGGSGKLPIASEVVVTPVDDLTSDDVQEALEELSSEINSISAGATNLDYTPAPGEGTVTTPSGTDATIPATDATNAGLFLPAEKTKLAAIEDNATADQDADEVPFDPTGLSILDTDVQSALATIHNDKINGINPVATTYAVGYALMHIQGVSAGGNKPQTHIQLNAASGTTIGLMTAADKAKLDSLVANYKGVYQDEAALNTAHATAADGDWAIVLNAAGPAQHYSWDTNSSTWEAVDFTAITGTTNLGYTASPTGGTITSDTGSDATLPIASENDAGLILPIEKLRVMTDGATMERFDRDIEGLYTRVEYYRPGGILLKKSVLSGGSTPEYTTRTEEFYDNSGTVVLTGHTYVYTLTYDSGEVIREELQ